MGLLGCGSMVSAGGSCSGPCKETGTLIMAARLVHLAAQGGRQALALVRGLHLPARAQPQVVDAVERARNLRTVCRQGRSAARG